MKNQIERAEPSRGAPDAASPGALRAARRIFRHMPPDDPKVIATAQLIDRESGHVVLLEALRRAQRTISDIVELGEVTLCSEAGREITIQALREISAKNEAAIQQAERT